MDERRANSAAEGDLPKSGMNVHDALRWASAILASRSDTPRLDAEVLLGHVLSLTRTALYIHRDDLLEAEDIRRYTELVRRRADYAPVAYLVGERAFYDVDLYVDRRVLIPRPETEHLVEQALVWARGRHTGALRIVDVGTGSGALALVLARHLPEAEVWAVDISSGALTVARRNLERYDLAQRVQLVQGDLLTAMRGPFDLIVANLPYVMRNEIAALMPDVAQYEPHLALDGGPDGLDLVRRLLVQASERLARPGLMLLEIDHRQSEAARRVAQGAMPDASVAVLADYAGLDRVVRVERRASMGKGMA